MSGETNKLISLWNKNFGIWKILMSVASFAQKKWVYANSPLFSERELNGYDQWTPAEIQQRRQKIHQWAKQRWAIPER